MSRVAAAARQRAVPLRVLNRHALRRRLRNSEPALIAISMALGALVGLVVVIMHEAINWLHRLDFGLAAGSYLSSGVGVGRINLLMVPTAGGLLIGLLAYFGRRFQSRTVVDPIEANALYGGRMSIIDSLRLAVDTVISNAAGASVGMEAAYSQMGAGMMAMAGQNLRLRRNDQRVFVAAGAAAAIAAAFNAPLAGAFYAYELVLGSYSPAALAQVAVASLSGTLVARATIGVAPIFQLVPPAVEIHEWEYFLFGLLGLVAGGIAIVTMQSVTWWEATMRRLPLPAWLRPAIGGAALSLIAFFFPQVLGSGHGAIQEHFASVMPLWPVAALLLAKMAASAVSIGAGFRGGLFSSSLFLGCLFGETAFRVVAPWIAELAGQQVIFILVGMGAVAAAIIGSPVTMVLLVLEATGDFRVSLAVVASVVTAATLVRYSFGYSFSTWRFHKRGVSIKGAYDVGWLADMTVGRLMRHDPLTVAVDVPLLRLRTLVPLGSRSRIFAIDGQGLYAGVIDVSVVHDSDLDDAAAGLVAGDLAEAQNLFLWPGLSIRVALVRFAEAEVEALPVLASPEDHHIVGYLTEAHALRRYSTELERRRSEELGERDLFGVGPVK